MSETQLLSAILQALEVEPGIVAWRNNTGTAKLGGKFLRFGLGIGSADIVGLLRPSGRFVALECKTDTGKLSKEQILWGSLVREFGGHYEVVRSVEEARAAVRKAREG